jgi:hypothetical protein
MDLVVFGHVFLGENGLPAVDKRISYFYAYCVPDHKSELQRVLFLNYDCVTFLHSVNGDVGAAPVN